METGAPWDCCPAAEAFSLKNVCSFETKLELDL